MRQERQQRLAKCDVPWCLTEDHGQGLLLLPVVRGFSELHFQGIALFLRKHCQEGTSETILGTNDFRTFLNHDLPHTSAGLLQT